MKNAKKALTVLIVLMFIILAVSIRITYGEGLTIVTTFPYLYNDLQKAVCNGDSVVYLLRPGEDPHEHMLTPGDIDVLAKASLIISTAHAPFELEIRKLVEEGVIKAKLVEVPSVPNLTILVNSATGQYNYHAVLFYPNNYVAFLKYISNILSQLRSECSNIYAQRFGELVDTVRSIAASTPKISGTIVVDTPQLQYIAQWLSEESVVVVKKEEDIPITPDDIERAREAISRGNSIVIVTQNSPLYSTLNDLAQSYHTPMIVLPYIESSFSIIDVLRNVSSQIKSVEQYSAVKAGGGIDVESVAIPIAIAAVAIIAMFILVKLYRGR